MDWITEDEELIAKESRAKYDKLGSMNLLLPNVADFYLESQVCIENIAFSDDTSIDEQERSNLYLTGPLASHKN